MRIRKLAGREPIVKTSRQETYDYYVSLDWSEKTMAVATMTTSEASPQVWEVRSDVTRLQEYLKSLGGRIILTFEESTSAHWLYQKLMPYVERLIVCNPGYNRLLCRGPKNDSIDAAKLCLLLRQGSLKEVYHSTSRLYELRLLVSAYEDTVRAGVVAQNQLKAHERGRQTTGRSGSLIVKQLQTRIELYHKEKRQYEEAFTRWVKRTPVLRQLKRLPALASAVPSRSWAMSLMLDASPIVGTTGATADSSGTRRPVADDTMVAGVHSIIMFSRLFTKQQPWRQSIAAITMPTIIRACSSLVGLSTMPVMLSHAIWRDSVTAS